MNTKIKNVVEKMSDGDTAATAAAMLNMVKDPNDEIMLIFLAHLNGLVHTKLCQLAGAQIGMKRDEDD